ncbi:hypothetical protein [Alicyclobacillus acidiphilus]|uniref:hypothetical protein n=1 Tax=Alicyclobacillus acidiphilus TaxID=182455 RepID=UPI00082FD4AF|nr:hypothetical protein [Alicyclobacillus acidiphilus]
MITYRDIRPYIGQHIQCHTHFGTFQGVIIHISKHHIILGSVKDARPYVDPVLGEYRPMPMGPGGPVGPGGPGGPGGPSGWQLAIPIAAILGITAVGMHWW